MSIKRTVNNKHPSPNLKMCQLSQSGQRGATQLLSEYCCKGILYGPRLQRQVCPTVQAYQCCSRSGNSRLQIAQFLLDQFLFFLKNTIIAISIKMKYPSLEKLHFLAHRNLLGKNNYFQINLLLLSISFTC